MGSILIRRLPDPIHKEFKLLCQKKNTSMEKEIVRLILRETTKAPRKKAPPKP
jgi:plasmid stability protein